MGYSCDFHFVLPLSYFSAVESLSSSFLRNSWNALLSSLKIQRGKAGGRCGGRSSADLQVNYHLQASVIRNQRMIAKTYYPVSIFDSWDESPPVCTTDFISDYQCQQWATLKKNFVTRYGTISTTANKATAFKFNHSRVDALTELGLSFTLNNTEERLDAAFLKGLDANITWRLRTCIFRSRKALATDSHLGKGRNQSIFLLCNKSWTKPSVEDPTFKLATVPATR